ncbi:major facilitator superfamily protein [Salinisphaera sp. T31B1]
MMSADCDDEPAEEPTGLAEQHVPVPRVRIFATIGCALMMMALDGTIVATALESLTAGLDTSVNWASWTITIYSFGFVVMLPVSGRLAVRFGNRNVFLGSVAVFSAASLCCALSDNIATLIALRALQAAGGAGFTPAATGIIVQHFGAARDRYVGLFGSIFPVGAMIGPIFGGLFVTYWSWRGIFLVNVPIGLTVAALVYLYVPRDQPRTPLRRARFDMTGLVIFGVGLLLAMFAVTHLAEPEIHAGSVSFLAPLVLGVGALGYFLRHIRNKPNPFIDPRLIHGTGFGTVNLINILYGGASIGLLVLVPLYAINRYGMNAFDAGTLLAAQGIAAITFSSLAAFALRSTGYRPPMYFGAAFIVMGFVLLSTAPWWGVPPYVWLAGATFLFGVGGGTMNPSSRNAGLQLAPDRAPSIAALRSMCMQVGRIATISIATAIIASSSDPAEAQSWIYFVAAVVLLCAIPVIARVPEHRGAW